ncbi:stomatal closure actin-binding-like protein [Rhynchospora pubera]|uniref:Stomatal closure actin-binding-like protein n=1 Tax=Rhynchospora pubera TaxID=906938 RepID=A0AAV8D3P9_9POAL|nr:stomatal closure actin-binding-like protein [Rhynchospora pubera]
MTRATYGYGAARPTRTNFLSKFVSYKPGIDSMTIEPKGSPRAVPLKELVAKEAADLIDGRQRMSVRELAMKFEKGLSTATWLSDEVKWRQVALLEREVLLKRLRDVLESLKLRFGGKNKDEIENSITMVETLAVQLCQREGELLQQKEQVKKLATSLKLASEDAKRIVEEERSDARIEIENAREAVKRVQEAFQEDERLSHRVDHQDVGELKLEVQEARRIKMLHHPSKVMDMEFEIQVLRKQLEEKSKDSIQLKKELDLLRRLKEDKKCLFALDGLEILGSSLHIKSQNISAPDITNCSIQWYRLHPDGGKREIISGAIRPIYSPDPYDVGRYLEAEISSTDGIFRVLTTGPIDPAPGLVAHIEALVRKPETAFNVIVLDMNGQNYPSPSIHALHIGRLRIKLCKGNSILAKEFYSSAMQVCGVRGGGDAAIQALFWGVRKGLNFVLAFESTRERNAAIMLARRFAVDCNIMLVGPGDPAPGWSQ